MLINVDVKSLIERGTTVDVYFILQLINEKQYDLTTKYLALYPSEDRKRLFVKLNESQYCTNYNSIDEYDPTKIELTPDFSEFLLSGDFFDELVQVFPVSATRSDGTKDFLRTDLKRTKKLYASITKNKLAMHTHILECLKFEISIRTRNGSMGWFKRFPNWLASEEWKVYEQVLKDARIDVIMSNNDIGYGTSLE